MLIIRFTELGIKMAIVYNIIGIIIGFALLIKGADCLVDGASSLAAKFGIPSIIIGLTVVAIGTSMPELVVSAQAALEGFSDFSIGNVVGSNIANLLLILGICAIIHELPFKKSTAKVENPMMLAVTVLLFFLANNSGEHLISRFEGIVLLLVCLAYLLYNIYMAKKTTVSEEETTVTLPTSKSLIFIIIGIVALKFGGDFVVNNATSLARSIGISEKLISVTIVSVATSLPELVTSLTATLKGVVDIAIGNIIGSNIFNIILILGVSSLISPINYALSYNFDLILLMIVSTLFCIFPFIKKAYKLKRWQGILFVLIYVFYVTQAVIKG